jgi:hypothetical protein
MNSVLGMGAWFITGVASLALGFHSLNVDVLKISQLTSIKTFLEYVAGASGLTSLIMFIMYRSESLCAQSVGLTAVWIVTGIVSLCIGLSSLGFNTIKTLSLDNMRGVIQIAAGVCGVWSLLVFFQSM